MRRSAMLPLRRLCQKERNQKARWEADRQGYRIDATTMGWEVDGGLLYYLGAEVSK